jgi:hypothetical protein
MNPILGAALIAFPVAGRIALARRSSGFLLPDLPDRGPEGCSGSLVEGLGSSSAPLDVGRKLLFGYHSLFANGEG